MPAGRRRGAPETPDFWGKLFTAYRAGCDWFQPMDISLPGDAITEDTVANGCLTAQPQEAEQEMLPHCPKVQTGIVDGFIDEDRATPLPVRAGGAVLFHPLTPHASLVNRTDGFRWSFDLRYPVTGEPSGRSWIPEFVARSRARPESVLGDWRRWRQMWEEAREHCADGPHRPIHRWASDSPFCA